MVHDQWGLRIKVKQGKIRQEKGPKVVSHMGNRCSEPEEYVMSVGPLTIRKIPVGRKRKIGDVSDVVAMNT